MSGFGTQPDVRFKILQQLLFLVTVCVFSVGHTQAQDSTLTRLIRRNQHPLTLNGTQFSGTGWAKLQQEVLKSQVVLIGEDHGIAEIPLFTTAIAKEFKPTLFIAEIDAYQAQDLSRLAGQPGLPLVFQKKHPMALSFYSWTEEFELARYLRSRNVELLGIDQVNAFSTGRFYSLLAEKSKDKAVKSYFSRRAIAYQANDRAAFGADLSQITILRQSSATLDSLVALTKKESPEVQRMVNDYVASARIYQTQSHQPRVNLMKRNVGMRLSGSQPLPKTLLKLGANHAARGVSLVSGVFDVGNLVLNLADAHDQKSLHILIAGKQGKKLSGFNLDDFSKNIASYSNTDEVFVKPFPVPTGSTAWQVFDMRPIRRALLNEKLKLDNLKLITVIMGYDYVVIIPETTASRNF